VSAAARIRQLVDEYGLPASAEAALERLLRALADDPSAPTSVRDPGAAVDAHLADSLAGLAAMPLSTAVRIADLGAGAGFPGLALAAARPDAEITLVEATGRKAEFIRRTGADAELTNIEVVHGRAEDWAAGRESCDAVAARALAALPVLAEYAAPLLRVGGSLVAWKGARKAGEEDAGAAACALLGLEVRPVIEVRPFAAARHRHLHVYEKVAETPERFPRRAGMAVKRPLGRGSAT